MLPGRGSRLLCPLRGSAHSLSFPKKCQEALPEPRREKPLEEEGPSHTADILSLASHRDSQHLKKAVTASSASGV